MLPVALSSLLVLLISIAGIGYVVDWDYGKLLQLSDKNAPDLVEPVAVEKEQPLTPIASQPKPKKVDQEKLSKEKTEVIKESLPRVFTIFTKESQGSVSFIKKVD